MAKIFSEALQDAVTGRWGFSVTHETDGVILEPIYIFGSRTEAESEIVRVLAELQKLAGQG